MVAPTETIEPLAELGDADTQALSQLILIEHLDALAAAFATAVQGSELERRQN